MHGYEKSRLVIVAVKPANKAERYRGGVGGAKGEGRGEVDRLGMPGLRTGSSMLRLAGMPPRQAAGKDTPDNAACSSSTRGGNRMRESRTYGSVRGAPSNGRPYRDPNYAQRRR